MKKIKFLVILGFFVLSLPAFAKEPKFIEEFSALSERWGSLSANQRMFLMGYASYREGRLNEAKRKFTAIDGKYPLLQGYISEFLAKIKNGGERYSFVDKQADADKNAAALTKIFEKSRSPDDAYSAARAQFVARDYQKAAELFLLAEKSQKQRLSALEYLATCYARLEKYDEAIKIHEQIIDEFPSNKKAHAKALFKIGFLHLDGGNYESARDDFSMLEKYSHDYQREQVRWYLAWISLKLGEFDRAARLFSDIERRGGKDWPARARFWRAESLERSGKLEAANAIYESIMSKSPLTYYGILSASKLGQKISKLPDFTEEDEAEAVSEAEAKNSPESSNGEASGEIAPDGLGERAKIILELDRLDVSELVSLEIDSLMAKPPKDADWNSILALAKKHDAWNAVRKMAKGKIRSHLKDGKNLAWEVAYPNAWKKLVEANGVRFGVDPKFIWSIMREESTFRPKVVSPAGAVGLMQLMPKTAAKMAQLGGRSSFAAERLFHPAFNIEMGTRYLAFLTKRYNGNKFLAAAAYNAGEQAVDRWISDQKNFSEDFVEEIPYKETRNYVKKVLKSYWIYSTIYK